MPFGLYFMAGRDGRAAGTERGARRRTPGELTTRDRRGWRNGRTPRCRARVGTGNDPLLGCDGRVGESRSGARRHGCVRRHDALAGRFLAVTLVTGPLELFGEFGPAGLDDPPLV